MKLRGKKSECACCGKTFTIFNENQVMYCRSICERKHDLFKVKEGEVDTESGSVSKINHPRRVHNRQRYKRSS